jgi:hypothetical protein
LITFTFKSFANSIIQQLFFYFQYFHPAS